MHMHMSITRGAVAVAAAGALSALGATGAGASGSAARAAACAPTVGTSHAVACPGAQLWVQRYSGYPRNPAMSDDEARAVAVSPDGATVFVTGSRHGLGNDDYATVAYNAATGTMLWSKRYNGPGNGNDIPESVAVSPAGDRVFVTGVASWSARGEAYATIAYNAATGAQLWVQRYADGMAFSVAVSPLGDRVFVTGESGFSASGADYVTVAYNAATGAGLWAKRYSGPSNGGADYARSVAVSPSGSTVFVTGYSQASDFDYATIAYNAATGAQLWLRRYNGPGNADDLAYSAAVSPSGRTVFVTGFSNGGAPEDYDYATIAYDAATGAPLWVKRYNGPGSDSNDEAFSMAISPTGGRVFVTGLSGWPGADYATVAYDATTGAQLWVKRYNGPGNGEDFARAVAVSPTGSTVFVTGYSEGANSGADYATVAYSATTGAQLWAQRYNGLGNARDEANSIAVSPTGGRVFVTGFTTGTIWDRNYTTIAYRG